jgi:hypothetical protein
MKMFIEAKMPRDKRNQNSELFFRQTQEVFGCLQLRVFNPKLRLSTAVKCDPVFIEFASMTHLLFISRTIEADSGTQGFDPQTWEFKLIRTGLSASPLLQSHPVVSSMSI